ncbi:Wzy [Citrobacter amalonaticus]|uniref:Wzy n=2 Tax=Enterobacteriaceae TaxID=543 RepID=A0AAX2BNJ1_CITAM|nr:Wzy [Citrobacter amalonaticus]SBA18853.1 Wzy [Citrobacter amalonaticus]
MYSNELNNNNRINHIGTSLFGLLIIFLAAVINDLPIQIYLGTLGSSPVWLVSLFSFIIIIIQCGFRLHLDELSKSFLVYYLLTLTISSLQCIWYYFVEGVIINKFGGIIFSKLLFASSYYLFYFLFIYSAIYFSRALKASQFKKCILSITFLLITVLCIEFFWPNILILFHMTMDGYGAGSRLRLLSPEPSMAAFTFNIFMLLTIALCYSKILKIIIWVIILSANILIGSKASLLLIMSSGVLVFYFNMSLLQKIKSLIIIIPIVIGVSYVIFNTVLPALAVDVEKFTSVSTRLITALWAIISLIYYPLGEGYGTYGSYFIDPLYSAINLAEHFLPFSPNLSEVEKMLTTGESLAAKSGVLFAIVQSGFIALIFFILVYFRSFRSIRESKMELSMKLMLRMTLWYSLLSVLFAVNIETLYAFLLPFITVEYFRNNY